MNVELLAMYGCDATACPEGEDQAPVLVMDLPVKAGEAAIKLFESKMRNALGQGRPVLVRDWYGDPSRPEFSWDEESLTRHLHSLSREVIWQG